MATVNNLAASEYYNERKEKAIEHLRGTYEKNYYSKRVNKII